MGALSINGFQGNFYGFPYNSKTMSPRLKWIAESDSMLEITYIKKKKTIDITLKDNNM